LSPPAPVFTLLWFIRFVSLLTFITPFVLSLVAALDVWFLFYLIVVSSEAAVAKVVICIHSCPPNAMPFITNYNLSLLQIMEPRKVWASIHIKLAPQIPPEDYQRITFVSKGFCSKPTSFSMMYNYKSEFFAAFIYWFELLMDEWF